MRAILAGMPLAGCGAAAVEDTTQALAEAQAQALCEEQLSGECYLGTWRLGKGACLCTRNRTDCEAACAGILGCWTVETWSVAVCTCRRDYVACPEAPPDSPPPDPGED